MKRAATQLFKRQSKNRAFFQNYRTFAHPPGKPSGKTEERKPDPWGTKMCESPGVARGDGQA